MPQGSGCLARGGNSGAKALAEVNPPGGLTTAKRDTGQQCVPEERSVEPGGTWSCGNNQVSLLSGAVVQDCIWVRVKLFQIVCS